MNRIMDILKGKSIHFIGIGGAGMNPMAQMLLDIGRTVSGSDLRDSRVVQMLREKGARIFETHHQDNIAHADIVVYSTAITFENPELNAAKKAGKILLHRSEMLNILMKPFRHRISVSGTHGKTTTTGMIAYILSQTASPSSFLVGSELENLETSYYYTNTETFVTEADESDGSFLNINSTLGVVTNIEDEHMNYYQTRENLLKHFDTFSQQIMAQDGRVIYNHDDPMTRTLMETYDTSSVFSFGIQKGANVRAQNIVFSQTGYRFKCVVDDIYLGDIEQRMYGYHNVCNALAAIAVCLRLGISFQEIQQGLHAFKGTKRRLEYIGQCHGVSIYDDYGHHPTEIRSTLEALRKSFNSKIFCVFQPHRFSRTKDLLKEFALSFDAADHIILTPIFSAQEEAIPGISSQAIIDEMPQHISEKTEYVEHFEDIKQSLARHTTSGDIVVTMGAGNIHTVSRTLVEELTC